MGPTAHSNMSFVIWRGAKKRHAMQRAWEPSTGPPTPTFNVAAGAAGGQRAAEPPLGANIELGGGGEGAEGAGGQL